MKRLVIGKKLVVYEEQRGSSTIMISDVYIYVEIHQKNTRSGNKKLLRREGLEIP